MAALPSKAPSLLDLGQDESATADPENGRRLNYRPIILVGCFGLLLIFLAVANYLWIGSDIFWSEILLHLGAGSLLSAVLFRFERRYETTRRETQRSVARIETLAQQTSDSIRALDSRLHDVLAHEDATDRNRASDFSTKGDYEALSALLERAQGLDAVSRLGVRIAIPDTELYLRICTDDAFSPDEPGAGSVSCALETADRNELALLTWNSTDPPDEIFLSLHDRLSKMGRAPNRDQFLSDSATIRATLSEMLLQAVESRTGADPDLKPIGKIFQRVTDEWFVTALGLQNIRNGRHVPVEDLRNSRSLECTHDGLPPAEWRAIITAARDAWHPSESAVPFW